MQVKKKQDVSVPFKPLAIELTFQTAGDIVNAIRILEAYREGNPSIFPRMLAEILYITKDEVSQRIKRGEWDEK